MFTLLAFALAGAPGGTSGGAGGADGGMAAFQQVIPIIYLFAIFYFLRIRPQKNKSLEHKALLESLKKGDNVITSDGVHGEVPAVENDHGILNVANSTNIGITKRFITTKKMN